MNYIFMFRSNFLWLEHIFFYQFLSLFPLLLTPNSDLFNQKNLHSIRLYFQIMYKNAAKFTVNVNVKIDLTTCYALFGLLRCMATHHDMNFVSCNYVLSRIFSSIPNLLISVINI